ncbi:MAG TPA: D-alanine--D-alanine ligase, partial [Rhodothermales bacterium]|nr:D-alanine--D-alanine ligase [Rhodothermales bacterium]
EVQVDVGLSVAESAHSRNREAYAPILFEMAGIPHLGSDALTLSLSLDKAWTKDLAAAAGVPTPVYRIVGDAGQVNESVLEGMGDEPGRAALSFPLFVKPRYEGSAKGIAESNRVEDLDALRREVARTVSDYRQDALVEAFVEGGGEFTVAVVGNDPPEPLPVLQRAVEQQSRIGLHALEHRGLPERDWSYVIEGTLTPELEHQLQDLAVRVYQKLECRDFARMDFRVDANGTPWFLEINTLPTFAPDGTFAVIAELMARPYPEFLAEVLARRLGRLGL